MSEGEKAVLIVQSKVRDEIRAKGGEKIRTSEEFLAALNDVVHEQIAKAIARAQGNQRATLRREDL
jgi:hypothetical protein